MTRIEKIENQIRELSTEERNALWRWFVDYDAEGWDAAIEADALAGRLDALADEALEAHRASKTRPA